MSTADNFKNRVEVSKPVQKMYSVIQKRSGAVGGYGHNGPVYGEVTMGTFQKVVNFLSEHLEFGPDSSFLDIGSGLGKPNLHVAMEPGVKMSFGVELEQLRWQLSMHNLRFALDEVEGLRPSVVYFAHNDITDIAHFEPFSHIYMFDVGFPPYALEAIARAFNQSKTTKALVSFQRPLHIIETYGFEVTCIGKVQTRMHGSSEGHTAYVYQPNHFQPSSKAKLVADVEDATKTITEEEAETVVTEELKSPRKSRKTYTPVKRSLRKQVQTPGGDKEIAVVATVSAKKSESAQKELFPRSPSSPRKRSQSEAAPRSIHRALAEAAPSIQRALAEAAPIIQLGMSTMETGTAYSDWVAEAGHIGNPGAGEARPSRNAKRILFCAS